jgi:hypothetical protein
MAKKAIKWQVAPAPTGRYRSFANRTWPIGYYNGTETPAALILCEDDYTAKRAKSGVHAELRVRIADHSVTPWEWRQLKRRYAQLDEAKTAAETFLSNNPHYQSKQ